MAAVLLFSSYFGPSASIGVTTLAWSSGHLVNNSRSALNSLSARFALRLGMWLLPYAPQTRLRTPGRLENDIRSLKKNKALEKSLYRF